MPNMIGEVSTKFQVGEIIAYRVWKVLFLREHPNSISVKSIYYHLVWPAHTPVKKEQDIWEETLYDDWHQYYGIHAFKTMDILKRKFDCLHDSQSQTFFNVLGRVKLWGEIIEHEEGYRAEYAQVMSIDELPPLQYFSCWEQVNMKQIKENFKKVQEIMN